MNAIWLLLYGICFYSVQVGTMYNNSKATGIEEFKALKRFHQFAFNNVFGIRPMHKRNVVPFPLLKQFTSDGSEVPKKSKKYYSEKDLDSTTNLPAPIVPVNHHSIARTTTETSKKIVKSPVSKPSKPRKTAVFPVRKPVGRIHHEERITVYEGYIEEEESSRIQVIEIRKIKRIGGGYPYGPKNMTIVEPIEPITVIHHRRDRSARPEIYFRKTANETRDLDYKLSKNIVALAKLDETHWSNHIEMARLPPQVSHPSLSCQYCYIYWNRQKSKPINIYGACCKE